MQILLLNTNEELRDRLRLSLFSLILTVCLFLCSNVGRNLSKWLQLFSRNVVGQVESNV